MGGQDPVCEATWWMREVGWNLSIEFPTKREMVDRVALNSAFLDGAAAEGARGSVDVTKRPPKRPTNARTPSAPRLITRANLFATKIRPGAVADA